MLHVLVLFAALAQSLQPPQQPPQPSQPAAGTATIRGHVFAADTGQPLRKAQVRITANEIRENRVATTDTDGKYEFTEVRPGRYTVSASKGSYVNTSYGQQRPTDVPKPVEILDRQTVERLDLSLPRGSVVTGRIVDEFGEPMPDVQVAAQRYQFIQSRRQLVPAGRPAFTNDLGEFRMFSIPPGQYLLTATWRNPGTMNPNNGGPMERIAFPPTYFPGTTDIAQAQRVTLRVGQQLDGVALTMKSVKAARVSGTVTGADGKPMAPAMLMVMQGDGFNVTMTSGGQVKPDGTFSVAGLAPGTYTLRAQRMGPSPNGPETATASLTLNGDDVSDVRLMAAEPTIATGRIVVDPAAAQQLPPTIMLGLFPVSMNLLAGPPPPPTRVADDLTFELKSTPGQWRVMLGGFGPSPAGWSIRAVRLNGIDVTDTGIDFKPGSEITGLEIEITNKVASVSGLVTDSRDQPSTQYTAIVFSQDKDKWTSSPRYQAVCRADQEGRFKVSGLPAGDYYIVAVDRFEPGQQGDPDFLESVRASAKSFSLMDGETKTVDLKLTTGM